jgi:hypothetical protein
MKHSLGGQNKKSSWTHLQVAMPKQPCDDILLEPTNWKRINRVPQSEILLRMRFHEYYPPILRHLNQQLALGEGRPIVFTRSPH